VYIFNLLTKKHKITLSRARVCKVLSIVVFRDDLKRAGSERSLFSLFHKRVLFFVVCSLPSNPKERDPDDDEIEIVDEK